MNKGALWLANNERGRIPAPSELPPEAKRDLAALAHEPRPGVRTLAEIRADDHRIKEDNHLHRSTIIAAGIEEPKTTADPEASCLEYLEVQGGAEYPEYKSWAKRRNYTVVTPERYKELRKPFVEKLAAERQRRRDARLAERTQPTQPPPATVPSPLTPIDLPTAMLELAAAIRQLARAHEVRHGQDV